MIRDQQQESAPPIPTLKIDSTWKEVIAEIERMTRLFNSSTTSDLLGGIRENRRIDR